MHQIDEEFNDLILKDTRIVISKAFILLEANIRKFTKKRIDAKQIKLIQNKASQMKKEIISFIDSEVERILKESEHPEEICSQDSEQQEGKQNQQRIFYLCDGKKEDCGKENCYKNGGECKHTEDIEHAKNFSKEEHREESSFWEEEKIEKGDEKKTPDNSREKRYAFEWFMREEDQRYWRQTKDLVVWKTQRATRQSMIFTAALWGITTICIFSFISLNDGLNK